MPEERRRACPVMKKICMGVIIKRLVGAPALATCEECNPLRIRTATLREQYVRTDRRDRVQGPPVCDADLKRLFSAPPHHAHKPGAAAFVSRFRRDVRGKGARRPGESQCTIVPILEGMIRRAQDLNVLVPVAEGQAKLGFQVLLSVRMNWSGRHRVAV